MTKAIKFELGGNDYHGYTEEFRIGRRSLAHLCIQKRDINHSGLKIAVHNKHDVLMGYAFAGPKNGDYQIGHTESWSKNMTGGEIRATVYKLLNDDVFSALIKCAD